MNEKRAALRLLDREVPEAWLREQTAQVAASAGVIARATKSLVIFRLGVEWLGLPTEVFQEVAEECTIHSLPHRQGGVLAGLVNVRGELLLCVSLEVLLGVEPAADNKRGRHLLVCNRNGDRLAFSVTEVGGIHRYNPEDRRDVPATLSRAVAGAYTAGMVSWNGKMVGCLDDELVFYALNKALA